MGWELWEFFGVEGLDTRFCWGFCGDYFRVLDRWRDQGREDIKGGLDTARVNACPSGDRGTRNARGYTGCGKRLDCCFWQKARG